MWENYYVAGENVLTGDHKDAPLQITNCLPQYMSDDEIQCAMARSNRLRIGGGSLVTVGACFVPLAFLTTMVGLASPEGEMWYGEGIFVLSCGVGSTIGGIHMIRKGKDIRDTYKQFSVTPIVDPISQKYGTMITLQF